MRWLWPIFCWESWIVLFVIWWWRGGSLSVSFCSHPQPILMFWCIIKTGVCCFFLSKHTIGSPLLIFQLYQHTEMLRMFSPDQSCTVIRNIFRCIKTIIIESCRFEDSSELFNRTRKEKHIFEVTQEVKKRINNT